MVKINDALLDDIRQQSDIVQIIGHYLPLVQKGNSVKCICPFHDDHNPSLSISASKQIYKCFVCGAAGNVFNFVQNFESIPFLEAVKRVADMGNIPFDFQQSARKIEKKDATTERYYALLRDGTDFLKYQLRLPANKDYLDYLRGKGLTDELIKQFEIGYQPKFDSLSKFLIAKGYDRQSLQATNIINNDHDVFSDRITFPLINEYDKVIGFSARSLAADQAKYLNTATNELYQKSKFVYNYTSAQKHCRKAKQVIICEGIMDVIAYARVGVLQVVATLGTACTIDQLKKIRQLSANICIGFDGDSAGQDATYKLGKLASQYNIVVSVLNNLTLLDPGDIIEKYSAEELVLLSSRNINWIEFLIQYLQKKYDIRNYSQKEKFAKETLAEINKLSNDTEKQYFIKQINDLTNFQIAFERKTKSEVISPRHHNNILLGSQMEIINQMLKAKEAVTIFQKDLGYLPELNLNRLAVKIIDAYNKDLPVSIALMYSIVESKELIDLLSDIENYVLMAKDFNLNIIQGAILQVKSSMLTNQIKSINKKISTTFDPQLKAKFEKEKQILIFEQIKILSEQEKKNANN